MRILFLTFYFEPDLCAGSFRNTSLVEELAAQLDPGDSIHVVTTQPNRYGSFKVDAPNYEQRGIITINRVAVPPHSSEIKGQIRSFIAYYGEVHRLTQGQHYDLVVASSSRLFTAFLGARLARKQTIPLFLDIRDLFRETILEMLKNSVARFVLNPVLKAVERYTFRYATHINLVSKGFRSYFKPYQQASYSYFTNGIDDEFLNWPLTHTAHALPAALRPLPAAPYTILYAGNIGEGQGLHKIIPQAARQLGEDYKFLVIGDGGARTRLEKAIVEEGVYNVELRLPVGRRKLLREYQRATYLFVHLNDLEAFKRVLPSKLFEYGATDKPILAGVSGYARQFIQEHVDNHILFNPGDVKSLVMQLQKTPYRTQARTTFVQRFQRKTIAEQMTRQILQTVGKSGSGRRKRPVSTL